MKKFFIVTALLILFAAQICYAAPQSLDRATANSQARQLFEINSAEGVWHSVYIIGEDEKLLHDWVWAPGDRIWTGNYFAYIGQKNSSTFALQNVELFAKARYDEHSQRINVTRSNHDGFIRVKGVRGLPDLLVSKIQVTGGGYFEMKVFAVKGGQLQLVRFLDDDKKTLRDTFSTVGSPMTYLDNGTLAVPWHTNATRSVAGFYETVYMFDVENLILIPAYTNRVSSPR